MEENWDRVLGVAEAEVDEEIYLGDDDHGWGMLSCEHQYGYDTDNYTSLYALQCDKVLIVILIGECFYIVEFDWHMGQDIIVGISLVFT